FWVFLGNGDGTFQAPVRSPAYVGTANVAVGDLNSDRRQDLAVFSSFGDVFIFYGRAGGALSDATVLHWYEGSFVSPLPHGPGGGAAAPAAASQAAADVGVPGVVADLNGDGRDDVASVMQVQGRLQVFLNRGGNTYLFRGPFFTGDNPSSVAFADFNGDGRGDLAIPLASGKG